MPFKLFQLMRGLTQFIKKYLTNPFALINQTSFLPSPCEISDMLCNVSG